MSTLYWSPWLAKIRRGGPVRTMPSFLSLSFYVFGWLCSILVRMAIETINASLWEKFREICTMFHGSCSHSHSYISYKSCGGPSLLVQCTQYKFWLDVIQTIEKARRRTLLEGLLAASSSKHKHEIDALLPVSISRNFAELSHLCVCCQWW